MFGLGAPEMIIIAVAILVHIKKKKIPDMMSGIGKGIREFKKAASDVKESVNV